MTRKTLAIIIALTITSGTANAFTVPHFLRGTLDCARNTVKFLRANRIAKVPETRSSKFFLRYHRIRKSQARFGDLRFNYRKGGGHIQPVIGWHRGKLLCLNPSHRKRGWIEKVCPANGIYLRVK